MMHDGERTLDGGCERLPRQLTRRRLLASRSSNNTCNNRVRADKLGVTSAEPLLTHRSQGGGMVPSQTPLIYGA